MPLSEIILIVMGLLTIAMIAAGISKNLPIPYTVFLVILGIVLGGLARSWPQLEQLQAFQLTPDLVLFLFLPALIFESAFNLDARQLLKNLAPVLSLAIPALLLSTALIASGLYFILDIDLLLALLFGALISATDPVAVLALFKELGAPQRLTVLIEGESLLNDATAIVVFKIILGLFLVGSFSIVDAGMAVTSFLKVFIGGAMIGAFMGIVLSELLYRMKAGLSTYLVMSIVLAYSSFALAEHVLAVSGVMAVLAAAISLSIFGISRVQQSEVFTVKETWEVLALICNSLLFLLVGLSVELPALIARGDVIFVAIFLVLLARALTIYTMVPVTVRTFGLPQISTGERHVMWWGGLKGGLAIAIVLSVPLHVEGRGLLLDMTLGVVLFSLLVNAPTIRPLMHALGIDRLSEDEKDELKHGLINAEKQSEKILQKLYRAELISRSTQQLIQQKSRNVFSSEEEEVNPSQSLRHLANLALRAEQDELKHLYDIGMIEQYIYLDFRNRLRRDQEYRLDSRFQYSDIPEVPKRSMFMSLEYTLIKRLREHDWAAGILARYQHLRFSQSLQRDMVGVLIAVAAVEHLVEQENEDSDLVDHVAEVYQERIQRRRQRLNQVAKEFPEFYLRFETRLFARVTMLAAQHYNEAAVQQGEIGSKTFNNIERRIKATLSELPAISSPVDKPSPGDLIGTVPLLNGLATPTLEKLADAATQLTFIAGDTIIGEGDRGDALYIISRGWVKVFRQHEEIAELRDGDFFGEMALLGDQVRTATVIAVIPTSLFRLNRKDVLILAEEDQELRERLEDANEVRMQKDDDR
ncbi:MAG: cyclic nucleotide-binding domain-containing protein [Gammaproteobacteria bacterium]|nr:cyclic nucleotide-binding domain-containing protein [Gammaproteobacteria bacterium]